MYQERTTAIILFARSLQAELRHRSYTKSLGKRLSQRLISTSHEAVVSDLKSTGLPVLSYDESLQRGSTFGQRLCHVIEDTLRLGYDQVVVVGGDCPTLSASDITIAIDMLSEHGLALGPDDRGGMYLLGITAQTYCRASLLSVRWQSQYTIEDVQKHLDESPPIILPVRKDMHSLADITGLLRLPSRISADVMTLVNLIVAHLAHRLILKMQSLRVMAIIHGVSLNRGPPALEL